MSFILKGAAVLASITGVVECSNGWRPGSTMLETDEGEQDVWESVFSNPGDVNVTTRVPFHKVQFANGLKFENQEYMASDNMNSWHAVKLTSEDGMKFKWTNKAGRTWTLTPATFDENGQPTTFSVGKDCPYYSSYKVAKVEYGEDGQLLRILGPGNEPYQYVIDWTNPDFAIDMPNPWKLGLLF